MRKVKIAAIQMACGTTRKENIENLDRLVRKAAEAGANIVVTQELFETPYFCKLEKLENYLLAKPVEKNDAVVHFQKVAKELDLVLPISFYEKRNNARYNSVAVIDTDGSVLGIYRKAHIPDGPGYEEKFYFNPGDTGFKVWETKYGTIGIGICWDQWFPETARIMTLMGADFLFYPTAIGSEPEVAEMDSKEHWQRCMQGHAAANIAPVIAANRIGSETDETTTINFYGSSFMTDTYGRIVAEASRDQEEILYWEYDLNQIELDRADWGVFRDRRPELYGQLLTMDGMTAMGKSPELSKDKEEKQ